MPYDQTIVNVDSEHSLVVVRASGGSTTVAMGPNSMSAQVAIGAFEIEDLLVGAVCIENSYLARSSLPAKEKFHDTSSELTSMQRAPSEDSTASSKEEFHDAPDDLPASGQQQQGSSQALVMQYNKWAPQSPEYHDVNAQVHVKLKTLSFFCNRPTLGALMAIGDDVSATGAAKPPDAPAAAVQQPSPQEDEGQEALEPTTSNVDKGKLCHAMHCTTLDQHASIARVRKSLVPSHILYLHLPWALRGRLQAWHTLLKVLLMSYASQAQAQQARCSHKQLILHHHIGLEQSKVHNLRPGTCV